MKIISYARPGHRWWGALVAAMLLLGSATAVHAQGFGGEAAIGPSTFRLGFNRSLICGATYTLTDSTGAAVSNSDSLTGSDIFAEFVFFNRFGIEFNTALTDAEREYKLESGGTLISNVDETARLSSVSANLYFQDQSTPGFKFFFGLGTGVFRVQHRFAGGTLGNESSKENVAVSTVKVGMDWLTENAGLRVQVISMEGDTTDTGEVPGFEQTLDYTATVLAIGVFAFF
jgi:hypothetical protein